MQYYYTKNFIGFGILLFLVFFIFTSACAKKEADYYKVTEINDGDTVSIVTGSFFGIIVKTERVRLIGIDAPELAQEPWGRRAKNHLRKLIKESDWLVKIELDVQHRDRYGRILAYLWDKNGRMLNYMMVRDGYAMVYTVPPNVKYTEWFLQAQRLARQEKRGIWGKDGLREAPSQWRKQHPQNHR
ncbi:MULTISPECIES: thermonuclease family protein [Thermodesulfovibrio]|jgi:micrococcal nuclease|uniref:Nuclease n=2 Tax=Thermodesulfovibrio TaxID=28261 RepID=A0A2J6WHX7_9BACT|nr:MAG: nuclease [Thermodesulfovibrio aggregans]